MEIKSKFFRNKELDELFCFEVAIISLILFLICGKIMVINPLIKFFSQEYDYILHMLNHNILAAIATSIYDLFAIIVVGLLFFVYFWFVYDAIYYAVSKKNLARDASSVDRNLVL